MNPACRTRRSLAEKFFREWNAVHRGNRPKKIASQSCFCEIDELYAAFKTDAELQAGKNNKAAGLRARKVSLELEKKLKEFRKTSLAAAAK